MTQRKCPTPAPIRFIVSGASEFVEETSDVPALAMGCIRGAIAVSYYPVAVWWKELEFWIAAMSSSAIEPELYSLVDLVSEHLDYGMLNEILAGKIQIQIISLWNCKVADLLRNGGFSEIWRQHGQFADLFPFHGTTKVGCMIHHPKLGNNFGD